MKTHQFFLLPLLFITGFPAADSISPNETKPKKAKPPKIKENNVLLLKKSNFDRALKETKYLLVEFCINFRCLLPWWLCRAWLTPGHSRMLVLLLLCPPVVLVYFVYFHVSISDYNYSNLFLFGVVKYLSAMQDRYCEWEGSSHTVLSWHSLLPLPNFASMCFTEVMEETLGI